MEHGNSQSISIYCSGLGVRLLFFCCSRLEHARRRCWWSVLGRIFWQADMCLPLCRVGRAAGSGAKISGRAAKVSGFSGSRSASCAPIGRVVRMAEIRRFWGAWLGLLEALRWKAGHKALIELRFLALRISLAGFSACPGRSIGPGAGRPPLCPHRRAAILLDAGTPDWPDLDPVSGARRLRLRRSSSGQCSAVAGPRAPNSKRC